MALTQDLSFILLGEDKTASKSMQGVQTTAEKVTVRIGSAFKRIGGAIGGDFGSVVTSIGGGLDTIGEKASKLSTKLEGGGAALTGIGLGLLSFGSGEVQATNQLNQAITAAGDATTDYSAKIDKAVGAAENFGHSAEDTKGALTILTEATGSTQKALDQMNVVTDLAAAKHISLEDAASLVSKILGGSGARTLSQYGIHLDGVGSKTEQTQRALDQLSAKLDGQAKASVSSFGGQVDVVKTKVFDWAKTISGPLGSALTVAGPIIAATGVIIDIVRGKQVAAAAATLAQAAAAETAGAAEVTLTGETVALDAAMDANPIGLVAAGLAAVAAIAGGVALASVHDLTGATQGYLSALQQANGLIDENVEKTAVKALSDDGALKAARELGIDEGLIVKAALGDKAAKAAVTAEIKAQTDALQKQYDAAAKTNDQLAESKAANAQNDLRDKVNLLTGAIGDQSQALKDAKQTYTDQQTALDSLAGKISLTKAQYDALTRSIKGVPSLHVNSTGQVTFSDAKQRASGGVVQPGELTTINDGGGPETLRLPSGTMVYPSGSGPAGGGGNVYQVTINAPGIATGDRGTIAKYLLQLVTDAARSGQIPRNGFSTALTGS